MTARVLEVCGGKDDNDAEDRRSCSGLVSAVSISPEIRMLLDASGKFIQVMAVGETWDWCTCRGAKLSGRI